MNNIADHERNLHYRFDMHQTLGDLYDVLSNLNAQLVRADSSPRLYSVREMVEQSIQVIKDEIRVLEEITPSVIQDEGFGN